MAVRDDAEPSDATITIRVTSALKLEIVEAARRVDRSVTSMLIRAFREKVAPRCAACGRGQELCIDPPSPVKKQ
jgi:hypothetical protein